MNEQSITIRREENPDGCTDISVSGGIDGYTHFREAFISLDNMPSLHVLPRGKRVARVLENWLQ